MCRASYYEVNPNLVCHNQKNRGLLHILQNNNSAVKHKWIDTGLNPDCCLDQPLIGLLTSFRILLLCQKTCFIFVAIYCTVSSVLHSTRLMTSTNIIEIIVSNWIMLIEYVNTNNNNYAIRWCSILHISDRRRCIYPVKMETMDIKISTSYV